MMASNLPLALHQTIDDAHEVAAHRAAHAAVVHFEHFFVRANDQVVVDADLTEFIDDHGVLLAVVLGQDAIQQRGFAGTEVAGQNGHGDLGGSGFRHGISRQIRNTPGGGVAPALARKRARQGLYIVPDHINVSGCRALFVGQTVRIERSADIRPGLGGDPPHQARITDVFQKNSRNFLLSDLGNDGCNVAGAGLGFRGNALRCDEFDPIDCREIAEGIVGRDHAAALNRNFRHRLPDVAIQRIEFREV